MSHHARVAHHARARAPHAAAADEQHRDLAHDADDETRCAQVALTPRTRAAEALLNSISAESKAAKRSGASRAASRRPSFDGQQPFPTARMSLPGAGNNNGGGSTHRALVTRFSRSQTAMDHYQQPPHRPSSYGGGWEGSQPYHPQPPPRQSVSGAPRQSVSGGALFGSREQQQQQQGGGGEPRGSVFSQPGPGGVFWSSSLAPPLHLAGPSLSRRPSMAASSAPQLQQQQQQQQQRRRGGEHGGGGSPAGGRRAGGSQPRPDSEEHGSSSGGARGGLHRSISVVSINAPPGDVASGPFHRQQAGALSRQVSGATPPAGAGGRRGHHPHAGGRHAHYSPEQAEAREATPPSRPLATKPSILRRPSMLVSRVSLAGDGQLRATWAVDDDDEDGGGRSSGAAERPPRRPLVRNRSVIMQPGTVIRI